MPKPIPDGFTAVTPYLLAKDAKALIDFITRAFNGKLNFKMDRDGGAVGHAEMNVMGARVMLGQACDPYPAMPAMIYIYCEDSDKVFAQAVAAGATVTMPVTDMFYGDRAGSVRDTNDNIWWISTHKEDLSHDEISRRMKPQKPPGK
jgi:PhnB protein